MKAKKNKLAMAILAFSLTQAANASEVIAEHETDHQGTFWGIGIGSILGGVIAGPPGAAIGATLGGSLGWGKDQHDALDDGLTKLEQQKLALQQSTQQLDQNQEHLNKYEQEIRRLKHTNAMQASGLKEVEELKQTRLQNMEFLKNLIAHYSQDILFKIGQSNAPDYTQERLRSLVQLMNTHPELHVTLKGYTDSSGSKQLNEKLAQARVDGIREILKTQGIDEARITSLAIGEVDKVASERKQTSDSANSQTTLLLSDDSESTPETNLPLVAEIKPIQQHSAHARRVSIELSLVDSTTDQNLAGIAGLQP